MFEDYELYDVQIEEKLTNGTRGQFADDKFSLGVTIYHYQDPVTGTYQLDNPRATNAILYYDASKTSSVGLSSNGYSWHRCFDTSWQRKEPATPTPTPTQTATPTPTPIPQPTPTPTQTPTPDPTAWNGEANPYPSLHINYNTLGSGTTGEYTPFGAEKFYESMQMSYFTNYYWKNESSDSYIVICFNTSSNNIFASYSNATPSAIGVINSTSDFEMYAKGKGSWYSQNSGMSWSPFPSIPM